MLFLGKVVVCSAPILPLFYCMGVNMDGGDRLGNKVQNKKVLVEDCD